MRIIAGTWRGRKLLGPIGNSTRPILDRVKVSLFDVLGSRYAVPGQLPPFSVLDLFCGTGSMGLEALSRGADRCTFVEGDRTAVRLLHTNIRSLDALHRCTVLVGNALTRDLLPDDTPPYDLIFVDPPYVESRRSDHANAITTMLSRLAQPSLTTSSVLLVCRNEAAFPLPTEVPPYRQVDRRVYRQMALTFYQRAGHLDADGSSA
jgi:16S rRNA (guanine966-N2)-methyltransferase